MLFDSLENLDPKTSLTFLNKVIEIDDEDINANPIKVGNNIIWQVDNFLTKKECDKIIQVCEHEKFDKLNYRDAQRIICFDTNECLVKTIEKRLDLDALLSRLNKKCWKEPYGFFSSNIKWNKNGNFINQCLRINKYVDSKECKWHRDAQYTSSPLVKSNYTILIYLNDDFKDGETILRIPLEEIIHDGITIKEELIRLTKYKDITIKPTKGMAIIFDQRLLHKGNSVVGTKYILRSDLVCTGIKDGNPTKLECTINLMAKQLFRHAQLLELENIDHCSDFYEICLSLRQHPAFLEEYPMHIEGLIKGIKADVDVLHSQLKLLKRSGKEYIFKYESSMNKFELLKIAVIYSILTGTQKLTKHNIGKEFVKLMKNLKINYLNPDDAEDNYSDDEKNNDNKINVKDYIETQLQKDSHLLLQQYEHILPPLVASDLKHKRNNKNIPFGIEVNVKSQCYKYNCEGCQLCDESCFNRKYKTFYWDEHFNLKIGHFEMNLRCVEHNKQFNMFSGKIDIITPSESFNHASCQCERDLLVMGNGNVMRELISYNIDFVINPNKIIITLNPQIVM
jgi:Sec-independent protein translocase protein TatA